MTTLIPELWPWLARHSGDLGFNEALCFMNPEGSLQAVWMLLCATCLSSFSSVVSEHFCASIRQACASERQACFIFDVRSIGLFKTKSISPSLNCFSVLKIFRLAYHHMSRWKETKLVSCFLYLGFCTEGFVLILGKLKDYSWRLLSTSTNGTIYSALMGSIPAEAPGLGSGTGLCP